LVEWEGGDSCALPSGRANDLKELRASLTRGFNLAQKLIQGHCGTNGRPGRAESFSVGSCEDIYVGSNPAKKVEALRRAISAATHASLKKHSRAYERAMGRARRNDRLASPLYVRISVVGNGNEKLHYPVMTWSRTRDPETVHVVKEFLDNLDAVQLCGSEP
jgi:hypothetical protein